MTKTKKYNIDFMRRHDPVAEQDYPLEWQLATLKARDGKPGDLSKLLRTKRPVPNQTLEFLANFMEVLEAKKLGSLYNKPLYTESDRALVFAFREYHQLEEVIPDEENRLEHVAKKYGIPAKSRTHKKRNGKVPFAGSEEIEQPGHREYPKLKSMIKKKSRDWQRLRHLFRKP